MIFPGPFEACTLVWEHRPREWSLSVCVKASFAIGSGGDATLASAQIPTHGDVFWHGDPRAPLWAASDFVPFKPRVDVLFAGSAYAPEGVPAERLFVRLTVGELAKTLRITGRRVWTPIDRGLRAGPAEPFVAMPIRYDLGALAGENRIGIARMKGMVAAGQPLPCVDAVEGADAVATPGFGPLPAGLRVERHRLDEASARWAAELRGPAPPGFDFGFFNAAPRDQQLELLLGAPVIILENLDRRAPRIEARLPALRPRAYRIDPATERPSEVALRADTLWIDGDRGIVSISWRGITEIGGPDEEAVGEIFLAPEGPGERVRYEDARRLAEQRGELPLETMPLPAPAGLWTPHPEWGGRTQVLPDAPPAASVGLGLRLGGGGVATSLLGALGRAELTRAPEIHDFDEQPTRDRKLGDPA